MRSLREKVALAALGVLAAMGAGLATAQDVPRQALPPPDPTESDRLPGPPTSPRAFAERDVPIPRSPPPGMVVEPGLQVHGVLVGIGPDEARLEVGERSPDFVLELTPRTFFYFEGVPVEWDDLPPGSEVRATYELDGHERLAVRLQAVPPGEQVAPPVLEPEAEVFELPDVRQRPRGRVDR